jgi:hypothetical protein
MRRRVTVVGVEIAVPPGVDVIPRFEFVPLDLVRQHSHLLNLVSPLLSSPLLELPKSNFSSEQNDQSGRGRERGREREREGGRDREIETKGTQLLKAIASFAYKHFFLYSSHLYRGLGLTTPISIWVTATGLSLCRLYLHFQTVGPISPITPCSLRDFELTTNTIYIYIYIYIYGVC